MSPEIPIFARYEGQLSRWQFTPAEGETHVDGINQVRAMLPTQDGDVVLALLPGGAPVSPQPEEHQDATAA